MRPNPRTDRTGSRGFALLDVVIAGVILAIGLATLFSLTSRSLDAQRDGEIKVLAAGMLDSLLSEVLLEGPADYQALPSSAGRGGRSACSP